MTIEERKAEIIGTNGIEASELVHEALCWYANEHIDTDKGKIFYFT
jgi:hypothetical protein